MLADGLKWSISKPRNWARLAQRLSIPGADITVAALGGSLTAGWGLPSRKQSWAYQFAGWLQEAFPDVTVSFEHNFARDGIQIQLASTCWYQYVPAAADIVLIDYNLNACGYFVCGTVSAPQIAAYENLLRRVMRAAPKAALLALDAFMFGSYNATNAGGQQVQLAEPYYNSGEEMHAMLTKRYRLPLTSARDAAYDYMYSGQSAQLASGLGATYEQLMQDPRHPTALGARFYGRGLAAYAARQLLVAQLAEVAAGGKAAAAAAAADPAQPPSLPRPVSPLAAQSADFLTFCVKEGHCSS
ncbi:hypothetical protein OEZ86_012427 [Tetradesmus obliquus]|nr:hypothetical protein OEZ86_012427 [Tetradesmus obliquus]